MICQGWRRLWEMQESLRRPYYQMLVRQLALERDSRGRGAAGDLYHPHQGRRLTGEVRLAEGRAGWKGQTEIAGEIAVTHYKGL